MRLLLLSSLPRRLAVTSAVSLFLVLIFFGFMLVSSHGHWEKKIEEYRRWSVGPKERCEQLFDQTFAEIRDISKQNCLLLGDSKSAIDCFFTKSPRKAELADLLNNSGCPIDRNNFFRGFPFPDFPKEPGTFSEYLLTSNAIDLFKLIVSFAALTILLCVLADVSRRQLTDGHVGWRRLTVVISVFTALATFSYWLWEEEHFMDALTVALCTLVVSMSALVYGRSVFHWVAAGFAGHVRRELTLPFVPPLHQGVGAEMPHAAKVANVELESPKPQDQTDIPLPLASYWPRFWARSIDLPLCWLVASIFAELLPELHSWVEGPSGVLLATLAGMVVICLTIFIYEVLFISKLGATPGKMLFGLSVYSSDNGVPNRSQSKNRAWGYLKSGLYFTFLLPTLQILGAIMAWRRRDQTQPWDVNADTSVRQKSIGFIRYSSAAVFAFCLVTLMISSNSILKEASKEEISRSILD